MHIIFVLSGKLFGNPVAFIGVAYLGICVALLGSIVLKAAGLN
ncbi:hypothetical protein EKPJFOCH_2254 [Methylobacterium thuringiense]|uniref:Uncharacterized protein n=1 Tax=Methylobacterium thuringiense TaxID=1003091 RepID=A0ABQ4TN72_9HYPH|nr:hypothetical protein EKPJFOCH_2254 [Methylobacterium thuringiense]